MDKGPAPESCDQLPRLAVHGPGGGQPLQAADGSSVGPLEGPRAGDYSVSSTGFAVGAIAGGPIGAALVSGAVRGRATVITRTRREAGTHGKIDRSQAERHVSKLSALS